MDLLSLDQTLAREGDSSERERTRKTAGSRHDRQSPFFTVPATTDSLLDQAFRLRYQVYCLERGFEEATQNPDGRERDCFDDHAVHRLLVHTETGLIVGGVRLVLPKAQCLEDSFPIQSVCRIGPLHPDNADGLVRTAEISRFCVSKAFRRLLLSRRESDTLANVAGGKSEAEAYLPLMTLELMNAVVQMSRENGIEAVCAAMEPSLLRFFSRLGLQFTSLGAPISFHGRRQPCFAILDELLDTLRQRNEEVWVRVTSPAADAVSNPI